MSYKKIPKLPQLSWCLLYTMIWYHCSPLVSCRFLRCKASVPTLHPLCPPAPWALDLHPWWCHHCHLCPMGWQLQPQRPWNPKQGNNTVVWGGCEVWDLGRFWEAKVGVTEMEWNLCFWSFFINMLGWTFCEIEDMDNGDSRWFTRWGGASKIDCSASMPQGLTSQSCLKDQLPQNIFLWFKKEVQYMICDDWIKRKLRHDASVPSIYIYISHWMEQGKVQNFQSFSCDLGLCLGNQSISGTWPLPRLHGWLHPLQHRCGWRRRFWIPWHRRRWWIHCNSAKWGQEILRLWDVISLEKIGDFSSCFFFCLISLSNYLELVQEILWFVLVCENAQIAPDQLQMCFIRRCWWTLNYIWYLVVPEVKDVQTLTANHKRGA